MSNVRLTVRVDFGAERALGPGKIRLLEAIGKTGSISRPAARSACPIGAPGSWSTT
jgi:molybdenum-dependent DNA-binding transcriptional regulator ModE